MAGWHPQIAISFIFRPAVTKCHINESSSAHPYVSPFQFHHSSLCSRPSSWLKNTFSFEIYFFSIFTIVYTMAQALSHVPDSSVHGILQARIPEWVTIYFSRRSSQHRDQTRVSCIALPSEPPGQPLRRAA